jgi:hypothetical protein
MKGWILEHHPRGPRPSVDESAGEGGLAWRARLPCPIHPGPGPGIARTSFMISLPESLIYQFGTGQRAIHSMGDMGPS